MSKIDKIIQIVSPHGGGIFGISESGRMYTFEPKSEASDGKVWPACWSLEIESPVVDNSACEVDSQKVLSESNEFWDNLGKACPVEFREDFPKTDKKSRDLMDCWVREINGFPPKVTK